jgi:hypothetical protein
MLIEIWWRILERGNTSLERKIISSFRSNTARAALFKHPTIYNILSAQLTIHNIVHVSYDVEVWYPGISAAVPPPPTVIPAIEVNQCPSDRTAMTNWSPLILTPKYVKRKGYMAKRGEEDSKETTVLLSFMLLTTLLSTIVMQVNSQISIWLPCFSIDCSLRSMLYHLCCFYQQNKWARMDFFGPHSGQ